MIDPVQSDETLWNDIQTTQPTHGQAAIWWLGQSGYAIKTANAWFYVDPYLSEHLTAKYANTDKPHIRMTRAPLRGDVVRAGQYVFASHKHSDHLDPGTMPALFATNPAIKLVLPLALVDHAVDMGLARERLIPMRGDDTLELNGITVHALPSAHPTFDHDETRGHAFLGFIFEADGVRLYHSGDTVAYPGLAERLITLQPDLMFLPINGAQSPTTPPNMSADQAVALAQEISGALVVPHHYDMFTFNTVNVGDFVSAADRVRIPYRVLQCGERYLFEAKRP
ncbi:MAG: MBL fold metallo-hydrolase [Chloroflexota bacterium]|nr:MBL fold metallo-hydrolase [Chloroflexota bacterium]